MTTVNESAPVIAATETEIAATLERVWELLANIERWPTWNPDVRSVSLSGPVAPGTVFRWKAGPSGITSTLHEVDPPRTLAWTGRTMGIRAGHVYRIEDRDGRTHVWTQESWEGFLPRLLRGRMHRMLQASLDTGLAHLKAAAERR
jgi:hypothetical protein